MDLSDSRGAEAARVCHQRAPTGEKTSQKQPHYLKNAHPWTSVAKPNGLIVPPMALNGNRRKSFARKTDGVFGRDNVIGRYRGSAQE